MSERKFLVEIVASEDVDDLLDKLTEAVYSVLVQGGESYDVEVYDG
ncbi:MAG: hypothetical protein WC965_01190 [Thiohalomonadaceae bacterium]